jgi:hypothetical protein
MACRLDVKKAILDQAFDEMFDGRYTFTRLTDDTIRINSLADDSKSKATSLSQAKKIAEQKLIDVVSSFKNAIVGDVIQYSPYDPVIVMLNVKPSYIEHEYQKLPESEKTDPKDRGDQTKLNLPEHTTNKDLRNKDGSKRYASTDGKKIVINPVTNLQEFFDYFEGKEGGSTSIQKQKVLGALSKMGWPIERIKSTLTTRDLVNAFLVLHEQSHIDNNDRDVYWINGKDLLTDDKIAIEARASIDALNKIAPNAQDGARMFQLEGATESSKASPKTIKLVKEFLKRIGVDYNEVTGIVVNGKKLDANAVALITQKMIQVAQGKSDTTLPEEAMHFFVEIIQQTNPQLFNRLLKEINKYDILKTVFKEYSNNPYYQKDGKPDVLKLKKEAIGKVLAETIIQKQEGTTEKPELLATTLSWWEAILDWFRKRITSSAFDEAALKVISGEDVGSAEDIRATQDEIYLSDSPRDILYNKLIEIRNKISKDEDNPDESKRGYYINGVKISKRVTDIVSDWYSRRFKEKQLTDDDFQKALNDLKAEKGTSGHKDMENAFKLFVDENGFLRDEPLSDDDYTSVLNPEDRTMYETLRDNLRERLNSFPEGTRFLSEAIVYDEKRQGGGIAGTIDFLAITKDGKVNILDWKFMDLNVDKYEDVPWYKINAWRQQMQQYKLILEKAYGVKANNFEQTRMIPIKAYYTEPNYKEKILPTLESIEIGGVKVELIDKDYLIPVGLEEETTGSKEIDELLVKLNGLYSKLSEQKATSEKAKREKASQLNALFSAIRQLQMKKSVKPLIKQSQLLNKLIQNLVKNYNENWKTGNVADKTDDAISQMYEELEILQLSASRTYSSLDVDLDFLFEGKELSDEDKEMLKELNATTHETRKLVKKLDEIETDYVERYVAAREETEDIMSPEKVVKGLTRWLSTTSVMQLRAVQTLFKKANRVLGYAAMEAVDETRKIQKLRVAYDEWARKKGLSSKNRYELIKKKDKNQLIDEIDREFYSELKKAQERKDYSWIIKNTDRETLKELMKERLKEEIESIENRPVITEEDEKKKAAEIKKARELYNIDTTTTVGWLIYDVVKKAPKRETWETKEWKELNAVDSKGEYINKPALDFYNYIKERNEYFQSIGYISKAEARVFLPFVRKSLMEKIAMGGKIRLGEDFLRAISIDEGDIGYGDVDPQTGEVKDSIPVYLTKEIDGEVSEDLFSTMSLYNELAIKFKYLSQIEYQARALFSVEKKKKSIATSYYGKTVYENGVLKFNPKNDENSKIYQSMMKAIIYQQKYINDEGFDQLLTKVGGFGKLINEKLGMEIFPENLEGRQISVNRVLDQLNNQFQFTVLGFNPFSALSNYLGGSFQSAINAGKYYTKTEFEKEVMWVTVDKMTNRVPEKYLAALEYFLPLTENYNRELAKTLSLSKLSQQSIQEFSMMLMRNGDWAVQSANFFAFLNNSIIENGEVVNAREYLRSQPEYENMYAGTTADRANKKQKFEEDVKKLIDEKGVMKLATLNDDGTFNIPGVDRKSDSVIKLRRKVQAITKDALGNLSEDDLRLINLNIFGKSFMVFKNWIPRPVDVRLGNLKYNAGSDAYEWGRMRMVYKMLSWKLWKSMTNMKNALEANEEGVEYMRKLWEQKRQEYQEDTGKELNMTESEFMDLVRSNLRNQIMELAILLTLTALVMGLKAFAPDDDEDKRVINSYKFLIRAMDKLRDELLYFYNPESIFGLISNGIFPSLNYLTNFMKLFKNSMTELYAINVDNEELEDKTHVTKYVMKSFPIIYQGVTFLPMFYPELAKDLGIRTSTEAKPFGQ